MTPRGTTLYLFVPSGPQFVRSVAFFQELGVTKVWESAGLAGLRFDGAYFILQDIVYPSGRPTK
jgi:hypothetical protein